MIIRTHSRGCLLGTILTAVAAVAPGTSSAQAAPATSLPGARVGYTLADVQFMQGMIAHHAQAVAMAALLPTRTTRPDMHLLAERIDVSQRDEIGLMRHWLEKRHEHVPEIALSVGRPDSTHAMGMDMSSMAMSAAELMPGMLTREQLTQLAGTKGREFDRLFLQDMIRHHEGALVMVRNLFGTNGAAQEPEIFQFASDIDADQRAEIMRMRALLTKLASPGATP